MANAEAEAVAEAAGGGGSAAASTGAPAAPSGVGDGAGAGGAGVGVAGGAAGVDALARGLLKKLSMLRRRLGGASSTGSFSSSGLGGPSSSQPQISQTVRLASSVSSVQAGQARWLI